MSFFFFAIFYRRLFCPDSNEMQSISSSPSFSPCPFFVVHTDPSGLKFSFRRKWWYSQYKRLKFTVFWHFFFLFCRIQSFLFAFNPMFMSPTHSKEDSINWNKKKKIMRTLTIDTDTHTHTINRFIFPPNVCPYFYLMNEENHIELIFHFNHWCAVKKVTLHS